MTAGVTRYQSLHAASATVVTTNSQSSRTYIPPNAEIVIKEVRFWLETAPGGSDTLQVVINQNGADSEFDVTFTGSDTYKSDTGSVTATDGDYLTIKMVGSATTAAARLSWLIIYEANDGALPFSNCPQSTLDSVLGYCPILGRITKSATADFYAVSAIDCTIDSAAIYLAAAPGVGNSRILTLQKNGVDTAVTITISDTALSGTASGAALDIAPGDYVMWKVDYTGTPAGTGASFNLAIIPDTPGQMPLFVTNGALANGGDRYAVGNGSNAQQTTEAACDEVKLPTGTISHCYGKIATNPGSGGDEYRATARLAAADTSVVVSIVDSATTGSDTTHSAAVTDNSIFTYRFSPINAPANNTIRYGYGMRFTMPAEWVPKAIMF
jgi:hypothetical protein